MTKTSYLEVYTDEISPRLKAIDLQLKSGEDIDTDTAADLLDLTADELRVLGVVRSVTPEEFLTLMRRGPSGICGLYRRELERRSPVTYTADDIAYIYGLDHELVNAAFDKLNASAVTEYMLAEIFAEIWISN
ncbi:MAG: hypothetical protein FWE68_00145 [Defluviitaleaceae bacterium]|nr:hypothetical protein [Defluviitaleaceae bacterium]